MTHQVIIIAIARGLLDDCAHRSIVDTAQNSVSVLSGSDQRHSYHLLEYLRDPPAEP